MKLKLSIVILFLYSLTAAIAVDQFIMEVESGINWLHNEAYGSGGSGDKDPDPILYRFGLAFPLYFSETFLIRPSLSVMAKSWEYVPSNGWAMPVDLMYQDLLVMSLLLDVPFAYEFQFNKFSLGLFAGPAFHLRVPLWGEDQSVRDEMISWFYGKFRFINIVSGAYFNIPFNEKFALSIKTDAWIPIHNIWASNGLPFFDGFMLSVSAGARFIF